MFDNDIDASLAVGFEPSNSISLALGRPKDQGLSCFVGQVHNVDLCLDLIDPCRFPRKDQMKRFAGQRVSSGQSLLTVPFPEAFDRRGRARGEAHATHVVAAGCASKRSCPIGRLQV